MDPDPCQPEYKICDQHWCRNCLDSSECQARYADEQHPTWTCYSGACQPGDCATPDTCFIDGNCYGVDHQPFPDEEQYSCLICRPDISRVKWTPRQRRASDPPGISSKCYINFVCRVQGDQPSGEFDATDTTGSFHNGTCLVCAPDKSNLSSLFEWSPIPDPDDQTNWFARTACPGPGFQDTMHYFGADASAESGESQVVLTPAFSGSRAGRCWAGVCRGMIWTPWLPLGGNTGGFMVDPQGVGVFGSFGGGFGEPVMCTEPQCGLQ